MVVVVGCFKRTHHSCCDMDIKCWWMVVGRLAAWLEKSDQRVSEDDMRCTSDGVLCGFQLPQRSDTFDNGIWSRINL